MTRKIEKWDGDIFPGMGHFMQKYRHLKGRELVIVTTSAIDNGLAHLIENKLIENKKESEDFLGLDDDGKAPLGSFGARIQLSYLLNLINEYEMKLFRAMKNIRNKFAHKVNVSFYDKEILKELDKILPFFVAFLNTNENGGEISLEEVKAKLNETNGFADSIFLITFLYFQVVINERINKIKRIHDIEQTFINMTEYLKIIRKETT